MKSGEQRKDIRSILILLVLFLLVSIVQAVPVSSFTVNQTIASTYPMVVQFTDTSTGSPTTWNWSFGDGRWYNGTNASAQNPIYIYAVAGKYNISLLVNDTSDSNITTYTDFINLTSDVDPNVLTWLHMNGTSGSTKFNGEQGLSWTAINGARISTSEYVYGGASGQFTQDRARISTPSSELLNINGDDFTLEFWIYPTGAKANRPIISRSNAGSTSNGYGITNINGTSNGYAIWWGNSAVNYTAFSLPLNSWTHVVIERNGTSVYIYKNGSLTAIGTGITGSYDTINPLVIGDTSAGGASNHFYMDEFRISNGTRWNANFTTPYDQYRGMLETIYPDIDPYSTLKFNRPVDQNLTVYNGTSYIFTLDVLNVSGIQYISGGITYDPAHITVSNIRVNTSMQPDLVLVSSEINASTNVVSFNVSSASGITTNDLTGISFVECDAIYTHYSDGSDPYAYGFAYGFITNKTTQVTYPIHNFQITNLEYGEWTFTANFTANTTTQVVNAPILFNSTFTGSYPNIWNWSWGDGTFTNGTEANVSHTYTTSGLKTVTLTEYLYQNASVNNTVTKTDYITVSNIIPVVSFVANTTMQGSYPFPVQFTDMSSPPPTMWNWSFGDGRWYNGTNASAQHPLYIYAVAGEYNVSLYASNSYGSNSTTYTRYINLTSDVDSYVASWMHFNGTPVPPFYDEMGIVWTQSGSPTINTTGYKYPDGSGGFTVSKTGLYRASYATLNFGSGDFTIEFWMYPTQNPEAGSVVVARTTSTLSSGWGFANLNGTESGYYFFMGSSSANATDSIYIPNNQWTKLDIERLNGNIYIYKNGDLVVTKPGQVGVYDVLANNVQIGYSNKDVKYVYYGLIDEFRINSGIARWVTNHTTPYMQYRGQIAGFIPDINQNSTLRFKVDPTPYPYAYIYNNTPHGERTLQIQNVTYTDYILGSITTDPLYTYILSVHPNTSTYNDIQLVSYEINNNTGIIQFNITRPGGFSAPFNTRVSIIDWHEIYDNYSANESQQAVYFTYGKMINVSNGIVYPVHNFIATNLSYGPWNLTANFTANETIIHINDTVQFTDTSSEWGAYPNSWNWSFGDGAVDSTNVSTVAHKYTTHGLKTVTLTAYMWQNSSISNVSKKVHYINVTYPIPVSNFTADPVAGIYPLAVQFTDLSTGDAITKWNWSFGDGNFSNAQNPIYVYRRGGNYTITLNATNDGGSNLSTKVDFIAVYNQTVAGFTPNVTYGYVPLGVQFNVNNPDDNATMWNWSFGDGTWQNGTTQIGYHLYNTSGIFTVMEIATNNYTGAVNITTIPNLIQVVDKSTSEFRSNVTFGYAPLSVQFIDFSKNATSWSWEFGDGNTSAERHPVYTFNSTGFYTITESASNAYWTNTTTSINYILVQDPKPIVNMSANTTTGLSPQAIKFNYTLAFGNQATQWNWSFGDGQYSTEQYPLHIYSTPGVYTVIVTAANYGGYFTETKSDYITIGNGNIILDFIGTPINQTYPSSTVTFTSSSSGGLMPTSWNWSFGDGMYGNVENPTHTYATFGTFTVILTGQNESSTNSTVKHGYLTIAEPLTANFLGSPTHTFMYSNGTIPAKVDFADTSNNATSWSWSFGDGNYSTQKNPTHYYVNTGNYTVTLTVKNAYGLESTETKTDYIVVSAATKLSIAVDMGQDYIQWSWGTNNSYYMMIDGEYVTQQINRTEVLNGTPTKIISTKRVSNNLGYYNMELLEPNSEHTFTLVEETNLTPVASGSATTTPHNSVVYIIVIISIILSILMMLLVTRNELLTLIVGGLNTLISTYGVSISYNQFGITYLLYALIVYSGIFIVLSIYLLVRGKTDW